MMSSSIKKKVSLVWALATLCLSGCGTFPDWIPASGASREQVLEQHDSGRIEGIQLVDVNDVLARGLAKAKQLGRFSNTFASKTTNTYEIGPGDVIEVTIWETPPAMLFGSAAPVSLPSLGSGGSTSVTLPTQMVAADGTVTIPFAGRVNVAGRTAEQIEGTIVSHLKGKANQPQVLVRVTKNNASNVTIVGEVNTSSMMPLTPKGERLLDALAFAGGLKQSVSHMAVQLSRRDTTATMALDSVIRDPKQNVRLEPGDVVTALFQPLTFSVLGATGKNDEIPF